MSKLLPPAGSGYLPLLALSLTFGVTASALPPDMDANQDEQVDLTEFTNAGNLKFSETDTNQDGQISAEERRMQRESKIQEMAERRFEKIDADGDGSISREESAVWHKQNIGKKRKRWIQEMAERRFEKIDADGDGSISREESAVWHKQNIRKKRKRWSGPRARAKTGPLPIQRFNTDTNADGLIDRQEYADTLIHTFSEIDKNGDGVLTRDEFRPPRPGKRRDFYKRRGVRR